MMYYLGKARISATALLQALTIFYFFYSFFEPYFNQLIGPIMKFYIILLVGLYVAHYNGKFQLNNFHKSILCWFTLYCISLLWARDYTIGKMHFFTVCGAVALLVCLTQVPIDNRIISYSIYTFWSGSFIVGLLSLVFHSSYYHYGLQFSARQVLTIAGVQTDPNDQAVFLLFGLSISLYYIFVKREKIILSIVTIVVNAISMMMTASRGGFLSFGLMVLIIVVFVVRELKTKVWIILSSLAVVVLIVYFLPRFISISSLERLLQFDTYEGGGNRITFWKSGFHLLNENLFYYCFGAGWGSYYNYEGTYGMHNTYIEMFCNSGIIGLLLFFYPITRCLLYLWKRREYLAIFIAIAIFLPAFFLDCINKRFFWNAIYFLFFVYFYKRYSDTE